MHKLNVHPKGNISGGYLQYSLNDQTGVINYSGEITVHLLFISKTFPVTGSVQVDPDLLKSDKIKPGMSYHSGPVKIEIASVKNKKATANVYIQNDTVNALGPVILDLSDKDITISSADLQGLVSGHKVELQLS